jgi:hypothetical protein
VAFSISLPGAPADFILDYAKYDPEFAASDVILLGGWNLTGVPDATLTDTFRWDGAGGRS